MFEATALDRANRRTERLVGGTLFVATLGLVVPVMLVLGLLVWHGHDLPMRGQDARNPTERSRRAATARHTLGSVVA